MKLQTQIKFDTTVVYFSSRINYGKKSFMEDHSREWKLEFLSDNGEKNMGYLTYLYSYVLLFYLDRESTPLL